MADYLIQDTTLTGIADAIRGKTGGTGPIPVLGMAGAISGIQTGGGSGSVSQKEVNFYDYDGTLVAAYTVAEAQALTALPDGPVHEGLVFQGWNWTLDKVKALTMPMNVGAMYITDDGKTRLYIRIAAEGRMNVPLYFSQTVAGGVTIDWGDGSGTETLSGTGKVNTTHTYQGVGDYVITLDPADGCTLGLGSGSSSYCVMGSAGDNGRVYCNMLQKVELGRGVTSIGSYAFQYCYSLASVNIPDSVTSIEAFTFYYCYSLASITIPDGVTSISEGAIAGCYSLTSVTIPDGVTSIGKSAFQYCYTLPSVTIPDGVTSIGESAFQYCYSLASVTIPDGVTSIEAFTFYYCYSLASITIPDGMTSIGGLYAFFYCYSLASVTIPDSVTSIGDGAFYRCYGMAEYHLKPTTPPTLLSKTVFENIPSDCVIYVPAGCLEAYQTATNWATHADKMREEPV